MDGWSLYAQALDEESEELMAKAQKELKILRGASQTFDPAAFEVQQVNAKSKALPQYLMALTIVLLGLVGIVGLGYVSIGMLLEYILHEVVHVFTSL